MIKIKGKIIVLDLDDTVYSSKAFTYQGFNAVSIYLSKITKKRKEKISSLIKKIFIKNKYNTFEILLLRLNLKKKYLKKIIYIYRYSKKKLTPYPDALKLLQSKPKELYLVTDGNKKMQKEKIRILKIKKYIKKIYITNQYGKKFNKPSLYCFNMIKKLENTSFKNIVYIGDNPKKDFYIKKYKILTIRIRRGIYKKLEVSKKFQAKHDIFSFKELMVK